MTSYDRKALERIHTWRYPPKNWWRKTTDAIAAPFNKIGEILLDAPVLGHVIKKSVAGLVELANDFATGSVRVKAIASEFRNKGLDVDRIADTQKLDLQQVDHVVGRLDIKYKGLAAAEGAAAGAIGVWGIPADIAALVTLNLRAIGEYSTYYGYDLSSKEERLFAMNILGLASAPTDQAKAMVMANLVVIAKDVAAKRTWNDLNRHAVVKLIEQIARAVGVRLTKAKLAQVLPVAGAVVGGGFNAWYTSKVCHAAYYLYRERFLAERYGEGILAEDAEWRNAYSDIEIED